MTKGKKKKSSNGFKNCCHFVYLFQAQISGQTHEYIYIYIK